MQPPRRRRHAAAAALALSLALAARCGSGAGKPPGQPIDGAIDRVADSASDGHHDAVPAEALVIGHCCALQLGDASSSLCQLGTDAAPALVEACLPQNTGGTYGRWTCGTGAEPPVCSNNGLSCGLGDPCTLIDVSCPGIVKSCDFTPYTPPPG